MDPELIHKNWLKHLAIVDAYISSPRKEKVLELFNKLEEKIILCPASGKSHFHNAFPGGYVDHVNRVVQSALELKRVWEKIGATIDFTEEELVFSALFHDFGKIGDGEKEGYVKQTDQWRQKNLGEQYTPNKDLSFMLIQDRSLFLLQKYNIEISEKEYLSIKLHDGLYEESNKPYYISYNPDSKFRTNIVEILHQADIIASRTEYNKWTESTYSQEIKETTKVTSKGKKTIKGSENLSNLIKNL